MNLLTEVKTGFEITANAENQEIKEASEEFNSIVSEAIDSALSTLGETAKGIVYRYLEESLGEKRKDIPSDIDSFAFALEKTFGKAAVILEARIIQTLHSKVKDFRYSPGQNELSFVAYVESLRDFL